MCWQHSQPLASMFISQTRKQTRVPCPGLHSSYSSSKAPLLATDALSLFPALRSAWWSSKGPERPADRGWTRVGAGPRILALGDATEAGGRHLVVLCTHHNLGTQGSGSELGERAWAGCLGWNKGDSVCAGISLRDTPGPFPRKHWCWLPKTAHSPPARTDNYSPSPPSLPHLWVFTLAVPWAWHPLSSLCTKLLLMPQGKLPLPVPRGPTGLKVWAVEGGASQGAPDAQGQELVSHHP